MDDPIFSNSKVVLSVYNDTPEAFQEDFKEKILIPGITEADVELLNDPTGINLAKLAIQNSDGIIMGSAQLCGELQEFMAGTKLPVLPFVDQTDSAYIKEYNQFYDKILGENAD